jgi:hypothetical protein
MIAYKLSLSKQIELRDAKGSSAWRRETAGVARQRGVRRSTFRPKKIKSLISAPRWPLFENSPVSPNCGLASVTRR